MPARQWTDAQKARQAVLIQSWKPWTASTGAKTPEGRAICSMNVLVGNAKREAALSLARQELKAAEEKVIKLSRGRDNPNYANQRNWTLTINPVTLPNGATLHPYPKSPCHCDPPRPPHYRDTSQ